MRTPLYSRHPQLGARMVDFAGWDMPVQYAGILHEHEHTRTAASLFDTCHMTEFRVWGVRAEQALARVLACRVQGLPVGRCRYGFLLNEDGGVIDDLIAYRVAIEEFIIVANASTRQNDAAVLEERIGAQAVFDDISDELAKIDLQGPQALDVLLEVGDVAAIGLRYFTFANMRVAGMDVMVSRTGYTGELGYELYVPADRIGKLWDALMDVPGVEPAGLGARDTLRLEMGYPLYGHELSEDVTPVDAGLEWALPVGGGYVGADGVRQREREGGRLRLAGICLDGRRAAREGDRLLVGGIDAGQVTSGCFAPSLGCAVALGYVSQSKTKPGTSLEAEVRGSLLPGRVARLPFHREGTVRLRTPRERCQ